MKAMHVLLLAATTLTLATSAVAEGTKAFTGTYVVRGVNGAHRTCDFSREEVSQTGHMTGASVQCANTVAAARANMPTTFANYCVVETRRLKGAARVIMSPLKNNPEHCDLSGIKPKDAQALFGGAQ